MRLAAGVDEVERVAHGDATEQPAADLQP